MSEFDCCAGRGGGARGWVVSVVVESFCSLSSVVSVSSHDELLLAQADVDEDAAMASFDSPDGGTALDCRGEPFLLFSVSSRWCQSHKC